MKITVAKSAGFCFGVRDAVDIAVETARNTSKTVQMLGHIVHNERVVHQLDSTGVKVLKSIDDADPDGILLIRAHGAEPQTYVAANDHGMEIVDATCPLVTEIHQKVLALHAEGYPVLVIGDHGHDEVKGIAAQVPGTYVVSKPEEVAQLGRRFRRLGVVCQSTQNVDNVKAIMAELIPICLDIHFVNTICYPTTKHQRDIRTMPHENDVMVIVGSFTSANTKRMTEISLTMNPRSHQVTGADELKGEWFEGAETVGVHAGASTPDFVIDEVVEGIRELAGRECEVA